MDAVSGSSAINGKVTSAYTEDKRHDGLMAIWSSTSDPAYDGPNTVAAAVTTASFLQPLQLPSPSVLNDLAEFTETTMAATGNSAADY